MIKLLLAYANVLPESMNCFFLLNNDLEQSGVLLIKGSPLLGINKHCWMDGVSHCGVRVLAIANNKRRLRMTIVVEYYGRFFSSGNWTLIEKEEGI